MKLRVGLVGLGTAWEARHRPALRALADRFEVRAVCEQVALRADHAARDFGASAVDGFRALAARDDVDAVLMLSPQWFGPLPIFAACDHGKAVYCAGTLNIQPGEVRQIQSRVDQAGIAFMCEFSPAARPCHAPVEGTDRHTSRRTPTPVLPSTTGGQGTAEQRVRCRTAPEPHAEPGGTGRLVPLRRRKGASRCVGYPAHARHRCARERLRNDELGILRGGRSQWRSAGADQLRTLYSGGVARGRGVPAPRRRFRSAASVVLHLSTCRTR